MISKKSVDKSVVIKIIAIMLVTLVSTGFAQTDVLDLSSDWLIVAALIMSLAFAVLGIAFMVSKVFGIPQWEAWVKEEAFNVLFSAVIIVLFASFTGVIEGVSDELAKDILASTSGGPQDNIRYWQYIPIGADNVKLRLDGADTNIGGGRWALTGTRNQDCPYPCHFYIARAFLGSTYERYGEMLKANAATLGGSILLESAAIGFGLGIHIYSVDIGIAVGFPLYAARAIFNNTLETVVQGTISVVTVLKMQETMLAFMPGLAGIFFVTGILSRILWFLRKFGGLLVALAIGIYVILPLVYVLGWYTVDRSIAVYNEDFLPGVELDNSLSGSLGDVGGADTSVFFTEYDEIGRVKRLGLLDAYGRSAISVILIPLIAIFTTIGFVRHFSPMIGGDSELAGLTRII